MAIFITGDTHGGFSRLMPGAFPELDTLGREDCVLICGDFGGVWDGSPEEQAALDRLEQRPFTTLFVDGNHENYSLLARYSARPWHGGLVQAVRPHVLHLMRGQLFELEGKRFFTLGGASSHDMEDGLLDPEAPGFLEDFQRLYNAGARFRVRGLSWWPEELPSAGELRAARDTLARAGWQADYIVTHCAPSAIQEALVPDRKPDLLTEFLEILRKRCRFDCWFFGHYHDNKVIDRKYILLYDELIAL